MNDVVPILTKSGCNVGVCHAKAITGQRGFLLSLLGYEPDEDYDHLVKASRGRRIIPGASRSKSAAPERGGPGSPWRWDGDSIPSPKSTPYWPAGFSKEPPRPSPVTPKSCGSKCNPAAGRFSEIPNSSSKQIATFADGSTRDVTRMALYESNDPSMALVSSQGLVRVQNLSGKVSVMVRYQGRVAVFSASIPLGAPVESLPPSKNFVDDLVFANLKETRDSTVSRM